MKISTSWLSLLFISCIHFSKINAQDPTQQWLKFYNGPAETFDEANPVVYDSWDGTIIVARRGFGTEGGVSVFVVKYNSDGDVVWDYVWDGPAANNDEAHELVVSPDGCVIYVIGCARGYTPNADLVVIKYAQTVNVHEENLHALSVYPNPANDFLTIQSAIKNSNSAYTIYTCAGTKCKDGTLATNQLIDMRELSIGLYSILAEGHVLRCVKH